MAFSGPLPRHTVVKADGESRTAPSRTSDDNDGGAGGAGGAADRDLADFATFGQETLEHIFREAEKIERACASFERSRGMRAGSANLDEVKALMAREAGVERSRGVRAGSANRVHALAAGRFASHDDDARMAELRHEFDKTAHCYQRAVNRERMERIERSEKMERRHRRSGRIEEVLQLLETAQGEHASMFLDVLHHLTERP